jgi:galactokinase
LKRGDYEEVGRQMYLTHEGLSRDYEVSCEELDFLVEEARRCGVTGARIMGGGFGGCTINLVRDDCRESFLSTVQKSYKARFGVGCKVIPVVIGNGARRVK